MKSLSILHIGKFYPPHSGGMETHLHDLAVRQARSAKVKVIVSNSAPWSESSLIEGVSVTRVARVATIASMPVCPGLVSAIRSSPADIVHLHMPNPGAALAFLLSGHTGKVVMTHHADTLGRPFLRRLSDPFVGSVMRRASRLLVTSTRYLGSSPELSSFRDKCQVVPLGIDFPNPPPDNNAAVARIRQQFGDNLILAVGRLVPYKGFDILIRAMKDIHATLLLIGTGPLYDQLSQRIASEHLEQRVILLGRIDDLQPYLAAASIFVLPSINRAEAFGIVQLEAMAAGLPVINTDIDSGVPEVSVHGLTGLTVPPLDPVALSEAMRTLLECDPMRNQFREAARSRVLAEFTNDRMAQRIFAVYEEILAGADQAA